MSTLNEYGFSSKMSPKLKETLSSYGSQLQDLTIDKDGKRRPQVKKTRYTCANNSVRKMTLRYVTDVSEEDSKSVWGTIATLIVAAFLIYMFK